MHRKSRWISFLEGSFDESSNCSETVLWNFPRKVSSLLFFWWFNRDRRVLGWRHGGNWVHGSHNWHMRRAKVLLNITASNGLAVHWVYIRACRWGSYPQVLITLWRRTAKKKKKVAARCSQTARWAQIFFFQVPLILHLDSPNFIDHDLIYHYFFKWLLR